MKIKVWNCLSWLSIVLILSVSIVGLYWMFYPYKTLTVVNSPVPVSPAAISSGEPLTLQLELIKGTSKPGRVTANLINDVVIDFPVRWIVFPKGPCKRNFLMEIPKYAPPGEYYIRFIVHYKMNPIRTIDVVFETQNFTIEEERR